MADSEPTPEKDEPPAVNGPATNQVGSEAKDGTTEAKNGEKARGLEQEKETDDFGLPVKQVRRRSSSTVEYETASEDENPKTNQQAPESASERGDLTSHQHVQEPQVDATEPVLEESSQPPCPNSCAQPTTTPPPESSHKPSKSEEIVLPAADDILHGNTGAVSGWSHQALAPHRVEAESEKEEADWQKMPAYAPHDLYDDEDHLVAREAPESDDEANVYAGLGGAGKGYTRVQIDEDAKSATSMDDNTDYLFKHKGTDLNTEDEDQRDPLAQLQATKGLLTEGQRIAYVGVTRLCMAEMVKELEAIQTTKNTKKGLGVAIESMKMWSQQMMVRLYMHMEIDSSGERVILCSRM